LPVCLASTLMVLAFFYLPIAELLFPP